MKRIKVRKKKRTFLGLFFFVLLLPIFVNSNIGSASSKKDSAELSLIFTTDIHGQLNSIDYELGKDYSNGGLARAYNLIKRVREEKKNSLTFDAGDVLYDYTTEFIYSTDQTMLQPIFEAMSMIGYDAITLGNHEFDYEFDYVTKQLKMSGLYDKVVVSNLTESRSGKYPFKENMMITKELVTEQNKKMKVKIGIIGETFPYLSTKAQDFKGILKVEGIIENVQKQVKILKEQGADIIVVLAHSGMGPEHPTQEDKNVSYAVTKLDGVDVVLCGHEHNEFPSEDKSNAYYKLSGIDKETELVNGKNLVMAKDRCRSIGLVDLKLENEDGNIVIVDRKSEVRKVTKESTIEEKKLSSLYDTWSEEFLKYSSSVIGTVDDKDKIENFHGLVEDNSAMQLLNNAKRAYALNYIHTKAKQYIDYPIIAASSYVSYGQNSHSDFVNISGELTEANMASLQKYNGYTALYKINGKQLREWLEWSASAYERPNVNTPWTNGIMKAMMEKTGVKSLLAQDWINQWKTYYVFDGIHYEINPLAPPRYNVSGVKINTTNRVTKITYNGKEVTDEQVFVLATGKLAKTTDANREVKQQGIYKGYVMTQGIISNYIKQRCKLGNLLELPDNNWKVNYPTKQKFLVTTSTLGEKQLRASKWFVKSVDTINHYIYSIGTYSGINNGEEVPHVLLTSTKQDETSTPVRVGVAVTGKNEIQEVKYVKGDVDETFAAWSVSKDVTNNNFEASTNGIYTVYAKDVKGNVNIQTIKIDNIFKDSLTKPRVETYTNRKSKIKGKADPNTTIIIETPTKRYETKTNTDGEFSYALPAQISGSKVTLYAKDLKNSIVSSKVSMRVKRTGPNRPSVYSAANNSDMIYGNLNDEDAHVIAVVDKTVYVGSEETADRYKNCADLYKKDFKVQVTKVTVDNGLGYSIKVPVQKVGTKIIVYTIDHLNRKSRGKSVTVEEVAPNPPQLYDITSLDDVIYGTVPSSGSKKTYQVYLTVGNETYEGVTDRYGNFEIGVPRGSLKALESVRVYAVDKVKGIVRISYCTSKEVKHPSHFAEEQNELFIGEVYSKDTMMDGSYYENQDLTIAVSSKSDFAVYETSTDKNGYFKIDLQRPLRADEVVYIYARLQKGNIVNLIEVPVQLTAPEKIYLDQEITNKTTKVVCVTDEVGEVYLKVGDKEYRSNNYTFNEHTNEYTYTLTMIQENSGSPIVLYVHNVAGKSEVLKTKVSKKVPDSPKVKKVKSTSKSITGVIDIVGETKVFARIKNKTYEGKIKEDGTFKIKIPKCKEKTKITVWGENEEGAGPRTKIKVVKAKSKDKEKEKTVKKKKK